MRRFFRERIGNYGEVRTKLIKSREIFFRHKEMVIDLVLKMHQKAVIRKKHEKKNEIRRFLQAESEREHGP